MQPDSDHIISILKEVVGHGNASARNVDRAVYMKDQNWPFTAPQKPDYIVKVFNTAQIRSVIRLAYRHNIPVIPLAQGVNVRGLCIPTQGGIIMDMRHMNRIFNLNKEMMTVEIEPGVTGGEIAAYFAGSGLRPAHTSAPDTCSIFANYLLRGLYHTQSSDGIDHIMSMEIVLPNGDIIQTGSAGVIGSAGPHGRSGGPDLTQLFMGVPGAFGVVTRMTVKLYPEFKWAKVFTYAYDEWEPAIEFMKDMEDKKYVAHVDLIDKVLLKTFMPIDIALPEETMDKLMPKIMLIGSVQDAFSEERYNANIKMLEGGFKKSGGKDFTTIVTQLMAGDPEGARRELLYGGRITQGMCRYGYYHALAFYGPLTKWKEILSNTERIAEENGFDREHDHSLLVIPTSPWTGQSCYYEVEILTVDPTDDDQRVRLQKYARECISWLLDSGVMYGWFRPYTDAMDAQLRRWGPTGEFMRNLKRMIDPKNIMNPGKFIF